jgi:hypothetical protein
VPRKIATQFFNFPEENSIDDRLFEMFLLPYGNVISHGEITGTDKSVPYEVRLKVSNSNLSGWVFPLFTL